MEILNIAAINAAKSSILFSLAYSITNQLLPNNGNGLMSMFGIVLISSCVCFASKGGIAASQTVPYPILEYLYPVVGQLGIEKPASALVTLVF